MKEERTSIGESRRESPKGDWQSRRPTGAVKTGRISGAVRRKSDHPKSPPATAISAPRKGSNESFSENKISNGSLSLPCIPEKLSSNSQRILDSLIESNPSIVGSAWVPIIDISPSPMVMTTFGGSHFGGDKIFLRSSSPVEWPICLNCHKSPMVIVAQIDRSSLPHAISGKGIVQVFVCLGCGGPGMKNPKRSICWANSVGGREGFVIRQLPDDPAVSSLPFRRVVKWLPRTDYMHPEDVSSLSIEEWSVLGEAQIRSDKVGGFPTWPSGRVSDVVKKLTCKICDNRMRLLIQVDSKDNVPIEWGNDGCVQVFECPNHPDIVSAMWHSS